MTKIQCPICNENQTSKELVDTIKYLIEYWFEHPSHDHRPEVYERIKYLDRRLAIAENKGMK
jgi:hypothetical protein